jgi:hypothetical protein
VNGGAGAGVETGDELGGVLLATVLIAGDAGVQQAGRVAGVAGVEVVQARRELGLERAEAGDLGAGLGEPGAVRVAHQPHRTGGVGRLFPGLHDVLDLGEGEPQILELPDPPDADEGVVPEEPVATLRARVRLEQPELFVQVDRADRLARRLGEIAHLEQRLAVVLGDRHREQHLGPGHGERQAEAGGGGGHGRSTLTQGRADKPLRTGERYAREHLGDAARAVNGPVVRSAHEMSASIYAFEEMEAELPRAPLCAIRGLVSAGIGASPVLWAALTPGARHAVAVAGSQEIVRDEQVHEALRGAPIQHIQFVAKSDTASDPSAPPRGVGEALRQQGIDLAYWPRLRLLDRWVLTRVSRNERLLHRALREIATRQGIPLGIQPEVATLLARCELELSTGSVLRLRSPTILEGRAFLLARVAGVRAARGAPQVMDRHSDTQVGPVELEWTTWEDRVLWQAHVSSSDGAFLPWVSVLAATTAATALAEMASEGGRPTPILHVATVRLDPWVVGAEEFDEPTGVHGRPVFR